MAELGRRALQPLPALTPILLWSAAIVLLPFGRSAELPMAIAAVLGLLQVVRDPALLHTRPLRWASLGFAVYWLPEFGSAFDAVNPRLSWREVAMDLRYLPMLWYFSHRLRIGTNLQRCGQILALTVALWTIDALLQAGTGWSLGGPSSADRLSGIFGAEDLKLGPSLAVLSPFLLLAAAQRHRAISLFLLLPIGLVLLLIGTRAAWLMFALVALVQLYLIVPAARRLAASLALSASLLIAGSVLYWQYPPFAERVERSRAALSGDVSGINEALSFRVEIWRAAAAMAVDHPLNGVGVRGYRFAYPDYVPADDRWLDFSGDGLGAAHPHQWLLEVLAETGLFGLICWLAGLLAAARAFGQRQWTLNAPALPASLALFALLFPLNTHYALYSSAWGGLLLVLLAGWIAGMTPSADRSVQLS